MNLIVGIGDIKISKSPDIITTIGLGSCIGITMYDPIMKIGGLAHIMLPDSLLLPEVKDPLKFADLAIPILLNELQIRGASRVNLRAKIAGGASMFKFADQSIIMNIGERNGEAVRNKLREQGVVLTSIDIGGEKGRTMILDLNTGIVKIRVIGSEIKEI